MSTNVDYNDRTGYDETVNRYYNELTDKMTLNSDNTDLASKNKLRTIELNKHIQNRRANYNTYKNQIEMQKELYNREVYKTIVLGVSTTFALLGCIAVWMPKNST
mgnify:CR=1 FL=1